MRELRPGDITDEMIQAMDTADGRPCRKDLRDLAANIRAAAEGCYGQRLVEVDGRDVAARVLGAA